MAGKSTLNRLELSRAGADALSQDQPRSRRPIEAAVRRRCSWRRTSGRRGRSSSIWMPPTTRSTAIRRGASSTAITTAIATCRSTSSAAGTCWRRSCGRPNIDARGRRGRGGGAHRRGRSASAGRGCGSCCAPIAGFAREALMAWCEENGVDYLFGLAQERPPGRRDRHRTGRGPRRSAAPSGKPARRFKDFMWTTHDSWSRRRRVVGKAEWTQGEANPRFVVTSLERSAMPRRDALYEKVYCARGEMENRIKECQLDLFADRTSTATMRANQLRLWFASIAYVLMCALRRIAPRSTPSSPRPPAAPSASSCSRSARWSSRQRPPRAPIEKSDGGTSPVVARSSPAVRNLTVDCRPSIVEFPCTSKACCNGRFDFVPTMR